MKRENYIDWEEYFMAIALLSAERSKDPSTQVGVCIVSEDNKILSTGYNGMPIGCSDDEMPWEREAENENDTKYPFVGPAELSAILNSPSVLKNQNARIYVALFPCNECAKAIIQVGIKEIIYADDKYANTPSVLASKMMLDKAGVTYRKYETKNKTLTLKL